MLPSALTACMYDVEMSTPNKGEQRSHHSHETVDLDVGLRVRNQCCNICQARVGQAITFEHVMSASMQFLRCMVLVLGLCGRAQNDEPRWSCMHLFARLSLPKNCECHVCLVCLLCFFQGRVSSTHSAAPVVCLGVSHAGVVLASGQRCACRAEPQASRAVVGPNSNVVAA
jgi:hypothetical protein